MSLIKFKLLKFEKALVLQIMYIDQLALGGTYNINSEGELKFINEFDNDFGFKIYLCGGLELSSQYMFVGKKNGAMCVKNFLTNKHRDYVFDMVILALKALPQYINEQGG